MRVLVADDSRTNRAFFKEAFEAEGFEVVTASDGREALNILREQTVDAIVSDILMPHIDGYRLCYEVRRDPKLRDIPIVILSASYTSVDDERLAGEFGADRFIRKSPSMATAVEALKQVTASPRKLPPAVGQSPADLEIMKEYSSRLVQKVEERNRELESTKEKLIESNRELFRRTEDLSRSEEKFRGIIENVQDIFFRANQYAVIEMLSPSVRRYGYQENDLIGAGIAMLCDDPGDPVRLIDQLARGNPISDFELTLLTKSGDAFIGSINARALYDENGQMTGFEGFVRDVTERRHSERVLREAEEKYRSIFENSVEGIIQCLPSGEIITANSAVARILGYDSPADLKASVSDIGCCYASPEDRADLLTVMDAESFSVGREVEFVRKDGSCVWTLARGRAVRDHAGNVLFYEATLEDIAERKRLERQLIHSQKMDALGKLAGGIAHDFNNLLTAIIGYASLAADKLQHGEPVDHEVREIEKAGRRAAGLTSQLLVFSRKQVVQPKILSLNEMVSGIENMLARLIGEDVSLSIRLDPDTDCIKADPGQIEQLIVNLAVNARDAMPDGGILSIETRNVELNDPAELSDSNLAPGPYVLLSAADNGIGMDQPTLSRIFEPFFTTKEVGKGTGLGLSTVFSIIQQMAGHIDVMSLPGAGTIFNIYIPASAGSSVDYPVSSSEAADFRGSETILLVEDEDAVRALTKASLQHYGYVVLDANNASTAIEICDHHQGQIDLVLTDIVMPDMSGPRLADVLLARRKDLKLIYMSGYTEDAIARSRLVAGAPFLQKPFTAAALCRKVREVLGQALASRIPALSRRVTP